MKKRIPTAIVVAAVAVAAVAVAQTRGVSKS